MGRKNEWKSADAAAERELGKTGVKRTCMTGTVRVGNQATLCQRAT
ncbi:MAG: hypothetical protein WED04_05070 [Promethearchaeati archaeon SRVP18_Atabeyarchaeia-1]